MKGLEILLEKLELYKIKSNIDKNYNIQIKILKIIDYLVSKKEFHKYFLKVYINIKINDSISAIFSNLNFL